MVKPDFKQVLNKLGLHDREYSDYDDYEDDYEEDDNYSDYDEIDEEEDDEVESSKKQKKAQKSFWNRKKNEEYDDVEEEEDDEPVYQTSKKKKSYTYSNVNKKKTSSKRTSTIKDLDDIANDGREVRVFKPLDFDISEEISDVLLSGRPVIINFSQVKEGDAQRIVDFVSGAAHAIQGTAKYISDTIIIVSPENISITGDTESENGYGVDIPSFGYPDMND